MDTKTQKNLKTYGGTKFNFGELNNDHTSAVREACEILKTQGVDKAIINELQLKFKVKELPKYDLNTSPFLQYCKKNNIMFSEQGNITVKENDKIKLYPVIGVVEDVRKLNKLFENIFNDSIVAAEQIKK